MAGVIGPTETPNNAHLVTILSTSCLRTVRLKLTTSLEQAKQLATN